MFGLSLPVWSVLIGVFLFCIAFGVYEEIIVPKREKRRQKNLDNLVGPGTELKKVLKDIGITKRDDGCVVKKKKPKRDSKGRFCK